MKQTEKEESLPSWVAYYGKGKQISYTFHSKDCMTALIQAEAQGRKMKAGEPKEVLRVFKRN